MLEDPAVEAGVIREFGDTGRAGEAERHWGVRSQEAAISISRGQGMDSERYSLTVTEQLLLERSFDTSLTRRRVRLVVLSAVILTAALIVLSPLVQSWRLLLFFSVAYILVTAWERVAYARTILAYKSLIRKLAGRIEELEGVSGVSPENT